MVKRIVISGFSGSGKSTLAKEIGRELGLPVIDIDSLGFTKEWNMKPKEEIASLLLEACSGEKWVLDGIYRRLAGNLIGKFDLMVFIDVGFIRNTINLVKRKIRGLIRVIRSRTRRGKKVIGLRNFKIIWSNRKEKRSNWTKFIEDNKDTYELIKINKVNEKTINRVIDEIRSMRNS